MHNKRKQGDYTLLKWKIFRQTLFMVLAAVMLVWGLYLVLLQGKFANGVVWLLQHLTNMDYMESLKFYEEHVRNNFDIIMFGTIIFVFALMFYFFLNWFVRYFKEIDQGINALVKRDGSKIQMSKEMEAMEKKLNYVSDTLSKQLSDIREAEQKKDELVLYLAHDIRTPLTSVIGYLTLLEDMTGLTEEQREKFIRVTLEKARRLEGLVNEFFDITRFSRQGIQVSAKEIDLYYMLIQLTDEMYPLLAAQELSVEIEAREDCKVYGDGDKLARIFNNILKNAITYSDSGSRILISVKENQQETAIAFQNHGETISKEEQDRIFDKFYRRDEARQTNSGGAGLGLAIAKELARLHGGTIEIESSEGITVFTVRLPRQAPS